MTENLRDRIAAAIQPFLFDRYDCPIPSETREVADAVIAELQLTQERDVSQWRNEAGELIVISRYVTDWKADDECP